MRNPDKTPPSGHTWDGTVEDVAARLGIDHAYAHALGAISAIVRLGIGGSAEERLDLIAKVLDAVDLAEQQGGATRA